MKAHEMSNMVATALTNALRVDPAAVQEIIDHRVAITERFLDLPHPFVVNTEELTLGPLGLINGVLMVLGANRIAAHYDDNGKLTGFWPCDTNGKVLPREDR